MATIEASIQAALTTRLETLVFAPAMPIAWPNVAFTAPAGPYLRVNHLPNATDRLLIGSDDPHRFMGIMQITVVWAVNAGETAPRGAAGQVANHFPADLRLVKDGIEVRITKRPDTGPLLVQDGRAEIPVSISYEAFA